MWNGRSVAAHAVWVDENDLAILDGMRTLLTAWDAEVVAVADPEAAIEATEYIAGHLRDLAGVGCDILTIGQYLRPSRDHLPMTRLYTPREFAELKTEALKMGFRHVESGPLVRSSYHAHEQAASMGMAVVA